MSVVYIILHNDIGGQITSTPPTDHRQDHAARKCKPEAYCSHRARDVGLGQHCEDDTRYKEAKRNETQHRATIPRGARDRCPSYVHGCGCLHVYTPLQTM